MLSAVKARKPRPRKAPKATSTRGRRNRPALTFRLCRRRLMDQRCQDRCLIAALSERDDA